ncbi:MAG: YfiT family bacillithiol transferase [Bacteroidota bacterium]
MNLEELKYPIGKYEAPPQVNEEVMNTWIQEIRTLPIQVKKEIQGLTEDQLSMRYRPEGWTIRQVVHHLSDSHLNALVRVKWIMTEDSPTIKPYFEARWAELPDSLQLHPIISINLLEAVHYKLAFLLSALGKEEWSKAFYHPEYTNTLELGKYIGLYAWHGRHHLTHIRQAISHKFK